MSKSTIGYKMVQLLATEADRLIGEKIRQRRKELGYSAEKLAEHINLSQQQISRYERGVGKINISHLVDIAVFLETPIAWFFQDCLPKPLTVACAPENTPEQQWHSLNPNQKAAFAAFLDTLRNKET